MTGSTSTTASTVRNSKGGSVVGGGGGSTVGVVRRIGTGSNASLSASSAGPTIGAGGFGVSVGRGTASSTLGARQGSARREGSVTSSDDGTVSEDSVEDPIQLFSGGGGHHINSLPFGHSSSVSSTRSSTGPKIASSSSVVSAAGSSVGVRTRGSGSSTVSTIAKPMRIAAGAAIKISSVPSTATTAVPSSSSGTTTTTGAPSISIPSLSVVSASSSGHSLNGISNANGGGGQLSTSLSSSTSSSSLSWVSSPSQRNSYGYEPGSTSPTSSTPASNQLSPLPTSPNGASSQNVSQTTPIRSVPIKTPTSGAASVAAASKLAEENRRQEEAARTRRKIADLEISNTSLLQINQSLEATIRKQSAEMQELKMRMQSAQFGGDLSWMTSDKGMFSQVQDSSLIDTMNGTTSPEAAVIIHELTESERQADITFKRLCLTIDQMLYEAKQALDQSTKPSGVKVLSSFDLYEKEAMEDAAHEDDLDAADQSIVIDEDEIDTIGGRNQQHLAEKQESTTTTATPATSTSTSIMTTALRTATTAA
ncbi:hypothetical protein BGZ97_008300 [Linnemannia gamsii]|uniref:Uncharacterized protein n=1 Tax=Linnemannia gamsii TaxID=64522 RepID=A0A9P6QPD1_9FUNG|nr:hypothetical protein BGZ97_008300 [Linnemannia gamsii]